jgi:anti-anti-sigma factor
MDISTSIHDKTAILRLKGRFDFTAHRLFRDEVKSTLANAAITEIQIDLSAVDYLDSSALGMLLLSRENAQSVGKVISLARVSGAVKQVLDIANFQRLFAYR